MNPDTAADAAPRPRRRRRYMIAAAVALVVIVVLAAVNRYYTRPDRVRALAQGYLQRFFHGRIAVGSAAFSWLDGLRLHDVSLDEPIESGVSTPGDGTAAPNEVFSCGDMTVRIDPVAALLGRPCITSIVAASPTCLIARDRRTGRFNVEGLLRLDGVGERWDEARLPKVELRSARLRVASRSVAGLDVVEDLTVTVRARPAKHIPYRYEIAWQSDQHGLSSGLSTIDLKAGRLRSVEGGLPWMRIESVMLAISGKYDGASAWYDLLGLDGVVRASEFDIGGGDRRDVPHFATIELSGAALSVPIDEVERRSSNRYLQFDEVQGQVRLTPRKLDADFTGRFHGAECTVSATVHGDLGGPMALDHVGWEAQLSAHGVTLPRGDEAAPPAEVRFVRRWPTLSKRYRDYDPHGTVDIELHAEKKPGADQPLTVPRLIIDLIDADFSQTKHPYRVRGVRGHIERTPEGTVLSNLHGRHGAGEVTVNGVVGNVGEGHVRRVTVTGSNLTLDDALWRAVPERFRSIRSRFDPHGAVDLTLDLSQPVHHDRPSARWQAEARIAMRNVRATYARFPYPVERLGGTLVINSREVRVEGVSGSSGAAGIDINGRIQFVDRAIDALDIDIRGKGVPFDEKLMAALPPDASRRVRACRPSGTFDLTTSLTWDRENRRVAADSQVTLNSLSVCHKSLPIPLSDVRGRLRVTPEETTIDSVTGRHGSAIVTIAGAIRADAPGGTKLTVHCGGLNLDEEVRAALPPDFARELRAWDVRGPVAFDGSFVSDPKDRDRARLKSATVRLTGADVVRAGCDTPFHDVRGEVRLESDRLVAVHLQGSFEGAAVRVDFDGDTGAPDSTGSLTVRATDLKLDRAIRSLLPQGLASGWDRLQPGGVIDLRLDDIHRMPSSTSDEPSWAVQGFVRLEDVRLAGGETVGGLTGTFSGSGVLFDRRGGTSVDGVFSLSNATLLKQHLTQAEGTWSYLHAADGEGMFALNSVHGRIYGGAAAGEAEFDFDATNLDYRITATVGRMQIGPFIDAARRPADGQEPTSLEGLADGHLFLSGRVGDASSRRGGGQFEVREGRLYRLPLIVAILNVLNLSIPDGDSLEEVRASFFVVGDQLQFEDVRLRGGSLALIGSGTMSWPDRAVNLSLINVSPYEWARVPIISEMLRGASKEFVELNVTGPISQPTVRVRPFRNVRDELKRLFRKKEKHVQTGSPP